MIVLNVHAYHVGAVCHVCTSSGCGGYSDLLSRHCGDQIKADANYGFAIGDRGFFNVTAQYVDRGATNRAAPYSGNDIFPGITTQSGTDSALRANNRTRQDFTMRVGQSAATEGMALYNAVVPLVAPAADYSF